MDTVFDVFDEVPYQFLEVSRGGVYGNRITAVHDANGVFKLRNAMVQSNDQELRQSASTLHVHPEETFMTDNSAGQGIRVQGQDYAIIGQTGGHNFATGELEHYALTLQNTDYSEFTEES